MHKKVSDLPLAKREEHLLKALTSRRFLDNKVPGNEVPFFICPFAPAEALAMEQVQKRLQNRLKVEGIEVLEINLYDLTVEILRERELWDSVLEAEPQHSKDEFRELFQQIFDPAQELAPRVREKLAAPHDIFFLTGIGEVFPYIRSHTVLNNLLSISKDKPMLMFFPGEYRQSASQGSSLVLFGQLTDDQYYRAFNIFDYHVN
ncbi:hypothetical protein AU252_05165 [Pseudarthrobacter sulfonivorans]|uniref:DUF1788 domain-containing protein n=1 Tax=Pseudarthrobacter sulfonivorans TaxID=121292 RepID=A0A0U3Q5Z6_9MICC|nr:DUF1788 domain-containing protein [Pseudarthrobacter sulfonivorans]ALV40634.1 hypothetical protein AU252_05165 [Pseudarthrobacter sulfonivorans]